MKWNAKDYSQKHDFVFEYGRDVVSLLAPQTGESILDIGCGTGELTAEISETGANIIGIDLSEDMLQQAKQRFPLIDFRYQDIRELTLSNTFDAVFSNAVLHWIPKEDQPSVCRNISQALKPNGRFIAEFGGFGNHSAIIAAETSIWRKYGYDYQPSLYFPTISEYTTLLESHGFLVHTALLFPRLTKLKDDEAGMVNLIEMFHARFMENIEDEQRRIMIREVAEQLRENFYHDGTWYADYVRIRISAQKI